MNEMLKRAAERHDQIVKSIAQREADIVELKEEAEKLDMFVSLARDLFEQKSENTAEPQQAAPQPVASAEPARIMPVRQSQSA